MYIPEYIHMTIVMKLITCGPPCISDLSGIEVRHLAQPKDEREVLR